MNLLGITVLAGLVSVLLSRSRGNRRIGELERLHVLTWAADHDIALCVAHGAECERIGTKSRLIAFGHDCEGIKRRYVFELGFFGSVSLIEDQPLRLPRWFAASPKAAQSD